MAPVTRVSVAETFVNIVIILIKLHYQFLVNLVGCFHIPRLQYVERYNGSSDDEHVHHQIKNARDITDMVKAYGYLIREHVVTTKDCYLLVVHKLEKPGLDGSRSDKVVYFHHGLLTNSELFFLGGSNERSLPILLLEEGYDVWLGNNRGNKYSRKHLRLSADHPEFWNFSLDEYAMYDIPDTVEYILNEYNQEQKLTYVGFSQGCSQLFASLSLNPWLNTKIDHFVGLSPAIIPKDLKHPIFKLLVSQSASNNRFLYSFFGTKAILPSVTFWATLLGPDLYKRVVDKSLVYLFGWLGHNISTSQKKLGYPHMFSNSSVKSVIHWFQIINSKRFQMFDDTCSCGMTRISNMTSSSRNKSNIVTPFPVSHHLDVPTLLVYGDNDILVDIDGTRKLITDQNKRMETKLEVICCAGYEHMDTLWGKNVYEDAFNDVVSSIKYMSSNYASQSTLTNLPDPPPTY